MAKVRRRTTARKTTGRAAVRRVEARARRTIARVQREVPSSFDELAKKLRTGLARLERQVEHAGAKGRRQAARLLRLASHRLGRLEAEGEKRWRTLTERARRDSLQWLQRVERAIEKSGPRPARRRVARRAARTAPRIDLAAGI